MSAIAELEKEDRLAARTLSNEARRVSALGIHKTENAEIRGKFFELLGTALIHAARNGDFDAFLRRIEWNRRTEECFYLPREHYLNVVVSGYQEVIDELIRLLIISLIKRGGKSQVEILFVLLLSGMNPNKSTLMEGLGDDLVMSFYNGCLEYLTDTEKYSFYEIFPDAKIIQTLADRKVINLKEKSRFPTIMCRSIDARQIGLSEATNVLCLDDMVDGDSVSQNQNLLQKLWETVSGDVMGRAIEGTPIVANGTRYSIHDPYGKLEDYAIATKMPYRKIIVPALREIGRNEDGTTKWESNYEYMRDGKKVFTTQFFLEQKELLTDRQFAAEFQQEPYESKGLMFPRDELNTYFKLPPDKEPDAIIACCDTAERGEDSVMMPIAYLYGDDVFIEDLVFDNSPPEITKPQCAKKLVQHKVVSAIFESNSAGEYFGRDVEEEVNKLGGKTSIRLKRTISNKHTRIEYASDKIKENFYFKDPSLYKPTDQYALMIKELTGYTRTGKVKHDDAADGLSLLENELRNLGTQKVSFFTRPQWL